MVFSIVNRMFQTLSEPPSIEEWDASRVKDLGIAGADEHEQEPVVEAVNGAHWLSVICYVEQIQPESLALEPALLAQIKLELRHFDQLDPLKVYAASIERLSEGEDGDDEDFEEDEEEDEDEDKDEYIEDDDDALVT
jgi:hypothetical protein